MGLFEVVALVALVMVISKGLRRRREGHHLPHGGPYGGHRYGVGGTPRSLPDPELQSYVETLETRVASLEERLDFTEKLLRERSEERGAR